MVILTVVKSKDFANKETYVESQFYIHNINVQGQFSYFDYTLGSFYVNW